MRLRPSLLVAVAAVLALAPSARAARAPASGPHPRTPCRPAPSAPCGMPAAAVEEEWGPVLDLARATGWPV